MEAQNHSKIGPRVRQNVINSAHSTPKRPQEPRSIAKGSQSVTVKPRSAPVKPKNVPKSSQSAPQGAPKVLPKDPKVPQEPPKLPTYHKEIGCAQVGMSREPVLLAIWNVDICTG